VAATQAVAGPRWALPPRPPETWVGGLWSLLLAVGVVVGVVLPLAGARGGDSTAILVAAHTAVSAVAALVVGHALVIEDSVRSDRRLRWLAAGYASAYVLLLARASVDGDLAAALSLLVIVAVPSYTLTQRLAEPAPRLLAMPALVLLAVAAVTLGARGHLHDVVGSGAWTAAALLTLTALVSGRTRTRPRSWVWLSLLLLGASAVLRSLSGTAADTLWWSGSTVETAAFVVPALGIGIDVAWGFGRQSRRWRLLETQVRGLRAASPLLPGRSVTPDDDEGLPGAAEVRALIEIGQMRVAVQPVVELATGDIVGHEALSRFGGRVPTDRWFKAASKYALGGELERMTLRAAIALLPDLPAPHFLAVNISPAALSDPEVVGLLDHVDLSRVVVEITEHEAVADYVVTRALLARLRAAGARIAVDDTGAGFASLRHVLMLQPDVIKLDTSLTRGIETDRRQQELVRAVTVFAAQVGAVVLAEGIETQGQLEQLRGIGVHLGQGWHLGVPQLAD
jgi:EAL domain-containing protein (putative c-di-GMP-specific phosphodiesterase class I)